MLTSTCVSSDTCHVSYVTCQVSHVTCQVSTKLHQPPFVTCHLSNVTCKEKYIFMCITRFYNNDYFFSFFFFRQIGVAIQGRVCLILFKILISWLIMSVQFKPFGRALEVWFKNKSKMPSWLLNIFRKCKFFTQMSPN